MGKKKDNCYARINLNDLARSLQRLVGFGVISDVSARIILGDAGSFVLADVGRKRKRHKKKQPKEQSLFDETIDYPEPF